MSAYLSAPIRSLAEAESEIAPLPKREAMALRRWWRMSYVKPLASAEHRVIADKGIW